MLILKYSRTGRAAYLPHLDVLRLFGRIVRRAGLKVRYSEGYNPHMELWFGNPVSLGIPSECEYCAADSAEDAAEFLRRFNEKSVDGIRCLAAKQVSKNPNFADILCAASYEISLPGAGRSAERIRTAAFDPGFTVTYGRAGKPRSAADKLLALSVGEDSLSVTLKAGKENMKADEWMRAVSENAGLAGTFTLKKTGQFFEAGGTLKDADELFRE